MSVRGVEQKGRVRPHELVKERLSTAPTRHWPPVTAPTSEGTMRIARIAHRLRAGLACFESARRSTNVLTSARGRAITTSGPGSSALTCAHPSPESDAPPAQLPQTIPPTPPCNHPCFSSVPRTRPNEVPTARDRAPAPRAASDASTRKTPTSIERGRGKVAIQTVKTPFGRESDMQQRVRESGFGADGGAGDSRGGRREVGAESSELP